jgi:formylglycine-generating enzyme
MQWRHLKPLGRSLLMPRVTVTVAARKPDWEELKKQLPLGTPKLDESALVAGAPVFAPPKQKFSLQSLAW